LSTALAARLESAASGTAYPIVELDNLYWRPGWQATPRDEFRGAVAEAVAGAAWVVCGNYRSVRDIVWGRADTVIWLDYPLYVSFYRLWGRTWRRIVTQEELWGGNRESWRTQFLSRESLLWYVLRTHRRRRVDTEALLQAPEYAHLRLHRLRRPGEAEALLRTLPTAIGVQNSAK
jgi:adenylate kinase family enzyme